MVAGHPALDDVWDELDEKYRQEAAAWKLQQLPEGLILCHRASCASSFVGCLMRCCVSLFMVNCAVRVDVR